MSSPEAIPVLITGIGGGGHGEQILKALRLGQKKYRILGTDIDSVCANIGLVDSFVKVPRVTEPNYLETILKLARQHQAVAIFHGSEAEMMVFGNNCELIRDEGFYLPVNPPELLATCRDKALTADFLKKMGFPAPVSREISKISDLNDFDMLPAIVKPSIGGGSANVFIAQTTAELKAFASYLLTLVPRFVAQEYVGTPDAEFTVGVLFGQDGAFLNSIGVKRIIGNALSVRSSAPNRTGRTDLGERLVVSSGVSQGMVGRWPDVTRQCEIIAKALCPTAPINIQLRLVDGMVTPFEINPRFSGTTSLRAMAGYNEPDVLIRRDVLGEKIEPYFPYREITIMRSLHEQELTDRF
ncbi:MAG: ATP-grasp domain-containing protein [Beijerinckiaceae bacterium]